MHFAQCEVGLQYVQVDFSRLLLFMFDPLLHFSTLPSLLSLPCTICTESECDSCGTEICINETHHTNIELENIVENCSTNRLFQIGVLLTHLSSPSKSNMYVVRLRYTRYWNPPHNFPAFSCEHSKNCLSNNNFWSMIQNEPNSPILGTFLQFQIVLLHQIIGIWNRVIGGGLQITFR